MNKLTIQVLAISAVASGVIEAARAVAFDNSRATAGARVRGINRVEAADGDTITIDKLGVFPWESGAALTAGDILASDDLGRAVPLKTTPTAITGVSQANPGVVTAVGHGLHTGERVFVHSVGGMTQLNGREFTVTVVDADTFSLDGEDTTAHTAYTAGGFAVLADLSHAYAQAEEDASAAGELPSVTRL